MNLLKFNSLILFGFLISFGRAYGNIDSSNKLDQTNSQDSSKTNYKIGPVAYQWAYTEYDDGVLFINDEGMLYGLQGIYESNGEGLYYRLEGSGAFGNTNYEGSLQNIATGQRTPHTSDSRNMILEGGVLGGYSLRAMGTVVLTPMAGLKTWYLRNLEISNDPYDYERIIRYYYVPIGFQTKFYLNNDSRLSLESFFNYFIAGTVESYIGGGVVVNDQNAGEGYNISIAYEQDFDGFSLSVGPFYRRWLIEDSNTETVSTSSGGVVFVTEPENETEIYGMNFLFRF